VAAWEIPRGGFKRVLGSSLIDPPVSYNNPKHAYLHCEVYIYRLEGDVSLVEIPCMLPPFLPEWCCGRDWVDEPEKCRPRAAARPPVPNGEPSPISPLSHSCPPHSLWLSTTTTSSHHDMQAFQKEQLDLSTLSALRRQISR
jgi:hypothetical protein